MIVSEALAINGGPKVRERPYPPWPVLGEDDLLGVTEVLASGELTQLTGGTVAAFEEAFAAWNGAQHCVATSSGTAAIHTVLAALDIGHGDEVIVPAHTFIASATPILHQRATPVFADVDEHTFCLSPESVAERITERTKAIIAVHLNGHPADMEALLALAQQRGIAVIEDAAQAHGAMYRGRKVGTIAHAGCFSFWEDKIITTGGEGGCVVTDDYSLAERMRRIRHHGEGPVETERAYYHLELGYNYRLSSLHAAVGLVQLERLDRYLEARRRNAAYLSGRLSEIDAVEPPFVAPQALHSYYKYICRLLPEAGVEIDELVRAVAAEGVPISRRYPTPLTKQPVFREAGYGGLPCPVAERLAGELFTLLVHPTVAEADLVDVVTAIRKVIGQPDEQVRAPSSDAVRDTIASVLQKKSRAALINKEDVQNRLVEFCLAALGWRLDANNTQVWLPVTEPMASLWDMQSARMKRDYVLSVHGGQVLHLEAQHKWRRYAVDLDTFLERINRDDWDDTRREGPNKDLGVLLWGAREGGAKRAALIDDQRLVVFEWDGAWRLAREVDLFVDPFERVYSAFELLAPPYSGLQ
jgi:perosamine synthetase